LVISSVREVVTVQGKLERPGGARRRLADGRDWIVGDHSVIEEVSDLAACQENIVRQLIHKNPILSIDLCAEPSVVWEQILVGEGRVPRAESPHSAGLVLSLALVLALAP